MFGDFGLFEKIIYVLLKSDVATTWATLEKLGYSLFQHPVTLIVNNRLARASGAKLIFNWPHERPKFETKENVETETETSVEKSIKKNKSIIYIKV